MGQVTDHLVEVYNGSSPNRLEEILECFNPDVRLLKLSGGAKIMEGAKVRCYIYIYTSENRSPV